MSKNRSSLALENDSLFLPLRSSAKNYRVKETNTIQMLISTHLWSRNLQFTFLCMIPGKIRCRRLFVSLSINVYFDWRSHCKSQSMIMWNDDANRAFIGLGKQKSKGRMSLSSVHIPSLFSSLCILLSVKYAKCKTILRKLVRFSVQKLRLSISRLPTCLREKNPSPTTWSMIIMLP